MDQDLKIDELLLEDGVVYLHDTYNNVVYHLSYKAGKEVLAIKKYKGGIPFKVSNISKDLYEARRTGAIVDQEFYINY